MDVCRLFVYVPSSWVLGCLGGLPKTGRYTAHVLMRSMRLSSALWRRKRWSWPSCERSSCRPFCLENLTLERERGHFEGEEAIPVGM